MKKILIPALLLLSAAVACQREKNVDPKGTVEITVTAGVPDTRTYIENDGTAWIPYWNTGDKLGVMVDDAYDNPKGLENTSDNGRTATFSGTLDNVADGEHVLTAWYPKDLKDGRAESVFKYVLAEEQTLPSLTSFDPAMDLLVGMPETFTVADGKANVDNMRFRRVFTVVKVTLKDESTLLALGESFRDGGRQLCRGRFHHRWHEFRVPAGESRHPGGRFRPDGGCDDG